jgi:hypothetical protein
MRFSALKALCAAPLALAATLQADLVAREAVGVEASMSVEYSRSLGGVEIVRTGLTVKTETGISSRTAQ